MTTRRKPLIAGNWKMHGSMTDARALVNALAAGVAGRTHATMLLCPPAPYLAPIRSWLGKSGIALGGQNLSDHVGFGAFTGEVAGSMLVDVGCSHVIVGHSERRALHGETDGIVAAKLAAAQAVDLVPILCVGETLDEREAGTTMKVVERQVGAVVDHAGANAFARAVIAYEPVWAIGTGRTASPAQAQEVHAAIRQMIRAEDATIAADLSILYGGSMKGSNAAELLAMEDIDGGLVGGASLDASQFLAIFEAASS